ncbi:hypothetical protein [Nocardia gamkensis]|jgi:hypothetical protein|uniref:hypothetical protein n=1 Tax=Nocardia gamkensis TaxID=352869 RepID=UPI0037C90A2B
MKVIGTIAIFCSIAALAFGGEAATAQEAVAQPVPSPFECKSDRKSDTDIEVRCYNLSSERTYRIRVSIDCSYQPDPSHVFTISRNDDARVTLSCKKPGSARGTFKYEVIQ